MTAMEEPHAPTPRRRPIALVILASLMLFKAIFLFLLALGLAANARELLAILQVQDDLLAFEASGLLLVVGVILGASAIGLLALRRWGWVMAMILTGAFVALDVVGFTNDTVSYPWMLLNIVTVFYLNQADVREVFQVADVIPGGLPGDRE